MANEWIMKPFFTLANDSRSDSEALSRAASKAETFQGEAPDDYVWVLHIDMKFKRMGVVFSDRSFNALFGWGLVGSDGQIGYMEFEPMISAIVPSIVQPMMTMQSAPVSSLTEGRVLEMFAEFNISEDRMLELIEQNAPQPDGVGISEDRAVEIFTELGVSAEQAATLIAELAPQPDGTGFSREEIAAIAIENAPAPDGVGVLESRAIELIEARVMGVDTVAAMIAEESADDITLDQVRDTVLSLLPQPEPINYSQVAGSLDYPQLFQQLLMQVNPEQHVTDAARAYVESDEAKAVIAGLIQATTNQSIDIDAIRTIASNSAAQEIDMQQIFNEVVSKIHSDLMADGDDIVGSASLRMAQQVYSAMNARITALEGGE